MGNFLSSNGVDPSTAYKAADNCCKQMIRGAVVGGVVGGLVAAAITDGVALYPGVAFGGGAGATYKFLTSESCQEVRDLAFKTASGMP
jgi:hypothetical protein